MTKNNVRIQPSRFNLINISSGRAEWRAIVEDSVKKKDVLNPAFWALVALKLRNSGVLPRIEIFPDNLEWLLEVVVTEIGKTHLVVKEVNYSDLTVKTADVKKSIPKEFVVKYAGPHSKWRVINPDGAVVKDKLENRKYAEDFLKNHLIALGN